MPDRWLGFETLVSDSHPGLCAAVQEGGRTSTVVQGTDDEHVPVRRLPSWCYVRVLPDADNGLRKTTRFELTPRKLSTRKLLLLEHERRMGRVAPEVLSEVQRRLADVFRLKIEPR